MLALVSASPAAAQDARDFQLPPASSPTPSPQTEGPVDDSGIVPVGPRALPSPTASPSATPAPSPAPTPTATLPTPATQPSARPVVQPLPESGSSAAPTARTPQRESASETARTVRPTPTPQSNSAIAEEAIPVRSQDSGVANEASESSAATLPETIAPPVSTSQSAQDSSTPDTHTIPKWLIWILAGAAGLVGLIGGLIWWRRREKPAPVLAAAPNTSELSTEPESPADQNVGSDGSAPIAALDNAENTIGLKLEIEQLSRSMMMMSLKCRITLANRSDKAARGITICADLVSANRGLPTESQIAGATAFLPEIGNAPRIGPHKTFAAAATLTLPLQQLAAFKHGGRPMFVPLVRIRLEAENAEPIFRTFVVGIAADPSLTSSSRLHPIPLDGIPGSFDNVRSRPIAKPNAG